MDKEISIVIFANAKDFFLTKICVASIRHFYPEIEILLVKDELNGKFSTRTLEKYFKVKKLILSKKYFGWAAAKLHFLIERNENKYYLCIDSDIIFVGLVLDKFTSLKADFIVSPEYCSKPVPESVQRSYFDLNKIEKLFPSYKFPGYFFNAGQTLVNPSKFTQKTFENLFDSSRYPYYLKTDLFPLVDQSILNFLLPKLNNENVLELQGIEFMKWSVSYFSDVNNNSTEILNDKNCFLIHYAGDIREINLKEMRGSNLLIFFQNKYLEKIGKLQEYFSKAQDFIFSIKLIVKIKYTIKKLQIIVFGL